MTHEAEMSEETTNQTITKPRLRAGLLAAFRILLGIFLLLGTVMTGAQILGIILGNGDLVTWAASLQDVACTIAGIAGVFSFALIYTIRGGAKAED
jgi:cytochrome bd-type quinol oxidase subunit 2